MAKLLKLRRGTTSQHSSFTGAEGEVTVDTTKDTVVVHDGSTAGGVPLAKESILIDEDNMSSNSATRLPSQQSVKAYVDGKVPTSITVADESSDTTCFPVFVTAATGDLGPKTGTNITFNSSTGLLTAVGLTLSGDLQVNGTTTTVASTTMTVADKNIEIAKGAANDAAADGAGITIDSGDGDKTWNWVDATDAWTSSEHIHLGDSKKLKLGALNDFSIWHEPDVSYLHNVTGALTLRSNSHVYIQDVDGGEMADFNEDGAVELYHNKVKKIETTAAGVTVTGTVIDSKGELRNIPVVSKSAAYTLVAADAGKCIVTDSNVTIPNSTIGGGDAVTIVNNSGSDITITASIGTLYNTADAATGNRTLAARGMATILFMSGGTAAYISGAGLS